MKRVILILTVITALAAFSGMAVADTVTMDVSANVPASCEAISVDELIFGDYNRAIGNDMEQQIYLECTRGTPYTIAIGGGVQPAGTRRLINVDPSAVGFEFLNYFIYQDSQNAQEWGDPGYGDTYIPLGADVLTRTGTGGAETYSFYGVIPPGQDVYFGGYNDAVIVTIDY